MFLLKAKAKPHGSERKRFRYSLEKPAIVPKIAPKVISKPDQQMQDQSSKKIEPTLLKKY